MSEARTIRKRTRPPQVPAPAPAPLPTPAPAAPPPTEPSAGGYEVGYSKPPVASRFRKGQSGNPRGRPKGSRNIITDIEEALDQKVKVGEGGKVRRIRKGKLIAHRL